MTKNQFQHHAQAVLPNAIMDDDKLYMAYKDKFGNVHCSLIGVWSDTHTMSVVLQYVEGKATIETWGDRIDIHKQGSHAWLNRMFLKVRRNIDNKKFFVTISEVI